MLLGVCRTGYGLGGRAVSAVADITTPIILSVAVLSFALVMVLLAVTGGQPLALFTYAEAITTAATPPSSHTGSKYFPTAPDDGQPDLWRTGDGLRLGDSYVYRICHDENIVQEIHPEVCYSIRLDFVYYVVHHAYGPVWVVDVNFDDRRRTILFVDQEMRVHPTSNWDRLLALSVENTIMGLSEYGQQHLAVGAHWADVKTYFHSLPLAVTFVAYHSDGNNDDNGGDEGDAGGGGEEREVYTATLQYGEHSRILIQNDLAFPVYGKWLDPMTVVSVPSAGIKYEYVLLEVSGRAIHLRQQ